MNNLIAFVNTFLSYLVVFAVFAICMLIAIFAGIAFRKKENQSAENVETVNDKATVNNK